MLKRQEKKKESMTKFSTVQEFKVGRTKGTSNTHQSSPRKHMMMNRKEEGNSMYNNNVTSSLRLREDNKTGLIASL